MGVDKVDLLIGPYSTNVIAAALPAIIQSKRMTIGIFGLGANKEYKYGKYFSMNSQGASPRNYSRGFFQLALQQQPKPARVALVGADVEFSRNALDGARENAKEFGCEVVFERSYPLANTEYATIVRSMQAAAPDVVYAATLPVDTVGIVRAVSEVQFKPKLFGGAFLGLLVTGIKQQLGGLIKASSITSSTFRRRACNSPAPRSSWRNTRGARRASASIRSASPIRPMPMPPGRSWRRRSPRPTRSMTTSSRITSARRRSTP